MICPKCGQEYTGDSCPRCQGPKIIVNNQEYLQRKMEYEKKQAEGKHYYVILGHIQKKLVRLIHSLMKSGDNYEVKTV